MKTCLLQRDCDVGVRNLSWKFVSMAVSILEILMDAEARRGVERCSVQ